MRDAVADLANAKDLHLDFYDRDRLATWVRDHAGIVTWVREKIGRPISGWRPYEDWAGSREGVAGVYLADSELRIQGPHVKGNSLPVLDGIERIRAVLSAEPGIVRFVGLSGTGKTRLAQALFGDRVGAGALAPDFAIYTNLSDRSKPAARCCGDGTVCAEAPSIARHRQLSSRPPQGKERNSCDECFQEGSGRSHIGAFHEFDHSELESWVDGDGEIELPLSGAHLGQIDVEEADGVASNFFLFCLSPFTSGSRPMP
jgi:hypothetical protein